MDLAYGVLIIIAGIVYVMWQYHKEYNGGITAAIMMVLFLCVPLAFWRWILYDVNLTVGVIGLLTHLGVLCWFMFGPITKKWAEQELVESTKIWQEVYALPLPDKDVLKKFKIANKIPLYPEDSEAFNSAAIKCWRVSEYNKRYTKNHKFVYYQKI